jgi:hypothetical protein
MHPQWFIDGNAFHIRRPPGHDLPCTRGRACPGCFAQDLIGLSSYVPQLCGAEARLRLHARFVSEVPSSVQGHRPLPQPGRAATAAPCARALGDRPAKNQADAAALLEYVPRIRSTIIAVVRSSSASTVSCRTVSANGQRPLKDAAAASVMTSRIRNACPPVVQRVTAEQAALSPTALVMDRELTVLIPHTVRVECS